MKTYKFWQTFRSGDDLTNHFVQLLHCRAEKLLPREDKLSCTRLCKAGKADTERLQASQVSPHPVLSTSHFYSIIFHTVCLVKSTYAIIIIYICLQNIKWHLLKIMLLTSHFLTETVTSQTWPASRHSVIRLLCHSFKALTTDVISYLPVWSQDCINSMRAENISTFVHLYILTIQPQIDLIILYCTELMLNYLSNEWWTFLLMIEQINAELTYRHAIIYLYFSIFFSLSLYIHIYIFLLYIVGVGSCIMRFKKSLDLLSARWRIRKVGGITGPSLKIWKPGAPVSKTGDGGFLSSNKNIYPCSVFLMYSGPQRVGWRPSLLPLSHLLL